MFDDERLGDALADGGDDFIFLTNGDAANGDADCITEEELN